MIHDDILNGILEIEGLVKFSNNRSGMIRKQREYIESLKPVARDLWRSYRRREVNTNYLSKETQYCYLLRYFVPYANLLRLELDNLKIHEDVNIFGVNNKSASINCIHASFFGSGPAPEIVGLVEHLACCSSPSIDDLQINLFDINSSAWKHSVNLIKKCVITKRSTKINVNSYQSDFSSSRFWTRSKQNKINKSNLVVFQNCLNEINDEFNRALVFKNIGFILFSMPKNSIIIFIDQPMNKYGSTDEILDAIEINALEKKNDLKVLQSRKDKIFNCRDINNSMPELIDQFLFYTGLNRSQEAHGLILRSNLDYSSLVIAKQ